MFVSILLAILAILVTLAIVQIVRDVAGLILTL